MTDAHVRLIGWAAVAGLLLLAWRIGGFPIRLSRGRGSSRGHGKVERPTPWPPPPEHVNCRSMPKTKPAPWEIALPATVPPDPNRRKVSVPPSLWMVRTKDEGMLFSGQIGAPHCDARVLHAPGICVHCDAQPAAQKMRELWGINFTGEHYSDRLPCPAEAARGMNSLNSWHGNRPSTGAA